MINVWGIFILVCIASSIVGNAGGEKTRKMKPTGNEKDTQKAGGGRPKTGLFRSPASRRTVIPKTCPDSKGLCCLPTLEEEVMVAESYGLHKEEMQRIMGQMKCPQDFECFESGFDRLCDANYVESINLVECLSERAARCKFSVSTGYHYVCKCPLRTYIARTFAI